MTVTPPIRYNSKVVEGLLRGNDAAITIDGGDAIGLVQEWQIMFDRPLTRLYDLIKPNLSYMELISSGMLVLNSVSGPTNLPTTACECVAHTITLNPGDTYCNGISPIIFTFTDCLPTKFILRGSITPELSLFNIVYTFTDMQNAPA